MADGVQDAIFREWRQRDKPIPRDLWHALLFYTTGEVIRPLVLTPTESNSAGSSGSASSHFAASGYGPYAVPESLYKRGGEDFLPRLPPKWPPHPHGHLPLHSAH